MSRLPSDGPIRHWPCSQNPGVYSVILLREKEGLATERANLEHEGSRLIEQGIELQQRTAELAAMSSALNERERRVAESEAAVVRDRHALDILRVELEDQQRALGHAHRKVEEVRVVIAAERASLTADKIKVRVHTACSAVALSYPTHPLAYPQKMCILIINRVEFIGSSIQKKCSMQFR